MFWPNQLVDTEELAHILPGWTAVNSHLIVLLFAGTANSVSEFIEGGKKWIKVIFNEEANYKSVLFSLPVA